MQKQNHRCLYYWGFPLLTAYSLKHVLWKIHVLSIHFIIMSKIFWKQHFMVFLWFFSISLPSILHFFLSFMSPSISLACRTAGSTVKASILFCCYASDSLYNHWSDYPVAWPWLDIPHNVKLVPSGTVILMVDTLEQKSFIAILQKHNMKTYEICFCLPSNQHISGGKGVWEG